MAFHIRKSFTFEAAHQLEKAFTSACSDCIHGHSYKVEMFLASTELDEMRMVLDFGYLKEFKRKVMEEWDHGLILHKNKQKYIQPLIDAGVLKASKVTFLNQNPTAEVMAAILFEWLTEYLAFHPAVAEEVTLLSVRVHETATGYGEYSKTVTMME